jgi:hypothetical protein
MAAFGSGNGHLDFSLASDRSGNSHLDFLLAADRSGNSHLDFRLASDRSGNSRLLQLLASATLGNTHLLQLLAADRSGNSHLDLLRILYRIELNRLDRFTVSVQPLIFFTNAHTANTNVPKMLGMAKAHFSVLPNEAMRRVSASKVGYC